MLTSYKILEQMKCIKGTSGVIRFIPVDKWEHCFQYVEQYEL